MVLRHFTTTGFFYSNLKIHNWIWSSSSSTQSNIKKTLTRCSKKKNTHYGHLHVNSHTCPPCNVTECHQHSNGGLKKQTFFLLFLFPTATSPSFSLSLPPSLSPRVVWLRWILSSSARPASCFSPSQTHTSQMDWGSSHVVHRTVHRTRRNVCFELPFQMIGLPWI